MNEMPKGGIQYLRDHVVKELTDSNYPDADDATKNLIENVITILQRMGRIQWTQLGTMTMIAGAQDLQDLADQLRAYEILDRAGADLEEDITLRVRGRGLSALHVNEHGGFFARLSWSDQSLDWMTDSQFMRLYPRRSLKTEESDND